MSDAHEQAVDIVATGLGILMALVGAIAPPILMAMLLHDGTALLVWAYVVLLDLLCSALAFLVGLPGFGRFIFVLCGLNFFALPLYVILFSLSA